MFASRHTAQPASRCVHSRPFGGSFLTRLLAAHALRRQRRALARLEACHLSDIGLSRQEALAEAARAAWDVPASWRR